MPWHGMAPKHGMGRHGTEARHGTAWHGMARHGTGTGTDTGTGTGTGMAPAGARLIDQLGRSTERSSSSECALLRVRLGAGGERVARSTNGNQRPRRTAPTVVPERVTCLHTRMHACACVRGTTHTDGEQNTPRMVFFISSDSMSLASCFAAASFPAATTSSLRSLSNLSVAWNIDVVTIPAEQCSAEQSRAEQSRAEQSTAVQ